MDDKQKLQMSDFRSAMEELQHSHFMLSETNKLDGRRTVNKNKQRECRNRWFAAQAHIEKLYKKAVGIET